MEGANLGQPAVVGDELGVEFLEVLGGAPGTGLVEEVNHFVADAARLWDLALFGEARGEVGAVERLVASECAIKKGRR